MSLAEHRRLTVLRRINDVIQHVTGPRLHESSSTSRSVRPEVYKLLADGLIERCDRDGESGFRRTAAGDARLLEATS